MLRPWTHTIFLCQLPHSCRRIWRGTLDAKTSSKAAGVPFGPLFGQVQKWPDVTLWKAGYKDVLADYISAPRPGRSHPPGHDTREPMPASDFTVNTECVLVHESATTGKGEMKRFARVNIAHSTQYAGDEVAREAGAKRLLLSPYQCPSSPRTDDQLQGYTTILRKSMWSRTWKSGI